MPDMVTFAISLPLHGTDHDYAAAVGMAMTSNPDALARIALSNLLSNMRVSRPQHHTEGRTTLVFGKMSQ